MSNTDHTNYIQGAPGSTVVMTRCEVSIRDRKIRHRYGADLLALAAGLQTDTDKAEWEFTQQAGMAPEICCRPPGANEVSISLSHSGSLIVAVASTAIACGIDVEQKKQRRFDDIAAWLKWPKMVDDFPAGLDVETFFRLWTLWEASIKLTLNQDSFLQVKVFSELAAGCIVDGLPDFASNSWRCWQWVWDNHYQFALVAETPFPENIRIYECETGDVFSNIAEVRLLRLANLPGKTHLI